MNERTRLELEFLSRWYLLTRSSTLRLLRQLDEDELCWRPPGYGRSAGWLLAHLAVIEELRVQRRLAGKRILPPPLVRTMRQPRPSNVRGAVRVPGREEVRSLLKRLKSATIDFIRGLIFGRGQSLAPDVIRQLERLIVLERQYAGQIHVLHELYLARPAAPASTPAAGKARRARAPGHTGPAGRPNGPETRGGDGGE